MRSALGVRTGFTMMDIMVSMAVISILIALLLPAVANVRESARKVICGSNMRQLGMGISIYSQDYRDRIPDSVFLPQSRGNDLVFPSPERMDAVRLTKGEFPEMGSDLWDGMGLLYRDEYITAPSVFYCPSHKGNFQFDAVADAWTRLDGREEIISNYLYRGTGPNDSRVLYNIASSASLVSDTLRSYEDLNHKGGFNILQAGLAVNWFNDVGDLIAQDILLRSEDDGGVTGFDDVWDRLDGLPEIDPDDIDGEGS
jgi:competence protein ComGC